MFRDGFLRFCDDPDLACCRAEKELEQLRTENVRLQAVLAELQELAKAKADGRLVELPCKVGTEAYKIVTLIGGETLIVEGNMTEYEINRSGEEFYFSEETRRHDIWCEAGCFGKTVFLTREAAEKAIAVIGGGMNG